MRSFLPIDKFIIQADRWLRAAGGKPPTATRESPAHNLKQPVLSAAQRQQTQRLMRVNHAGEVAAQALYQGQAFTGRNAQLIQQLQHAADEEYDHLSWCAERIKELKGHTSYLNPLWYAGSFAIGALAGAWGDKWSLGFLVETEEQVVAHLEKHLEKLPAEDIKSRRILLQMKADEAEHAQKAQQAGAVEVPFAIKLGMKLVSKVMTTTAYFI